MTQWMCVLGMMAVTFVANADHHREGKPIHPFNGKDLKGWTTKKPESKSRWDTGVAVVSKAEPKRLHIGLGSGDLINDVAGHGQGVDIYSLEKFGSCRIELEVMVAKGSNSGIYVMGEYEVQVLDSYGKTKLGSGDMGAIYGAAPPKINACTPPGTWQKYVIEFLAPKFNDNGEKTRNAKFLKVQLNGQILHENIEMKGPTPSGVTGKETPKGPIMFQGDHGPVAYRNIKITPLH